MRITVLAVVRLLAMLRLFLVGTKCLARARWRRRWHLRIRLWMHLWSVLKTAQERPREPWALVRPGVERGVAQDAACGVEVLYSRGPIAGMPEEHTKHDVRGFRRWTISNRKPGKSSCAKKREVQWWMPFFSTPEGVGYKAFADARREALRCSKK